MCKLRKSKPGLFWRIVDKMIPNALRTLEEKTEEVRGVEGIRRTPRGF